ncbi:MAG: class I SAM-dependent methyltransferase [Candidatus Scalindua sp.]|nr:class I SAM-dependent methyltransferase [Candidatus Scalindua sp.]
MGKKSSVAYFMKNYLSLPLSLKTIGRSIDRHGIIFPFRVIRFLYYKIFIIRDLLYEITFDYKYGTKTGIIVSHCQLDYKDAKIHKDAYGHVPTSPYATISALKALKKKCLHDLKSETIVDYGCGTGRMLIIAAESGFGNVTGIEMSPYLAKLCQRNIQKYSRSHKNLNITVLEQDAVKYIPHVNDIVFHFYDPFNINVCKKVIANIKHSVQANPRTIYIIDNRLKLDLSTEGFEFVIEVKGIKIFKYSY